MESHLKKKNLIGDGYKHLPGRVVFELGQDCKTAMCEAIELAKEFETIEESKLAATLRLEQCKLHVNGQHHECPDDSSCKTRDPPSFLLQNQNKFGEEQRKKVNEVVFDKLLCTPEFVEKNCLWIGSTSANENLHWQIYGRNLISKCTHKNTYTNSIEAGYKCGVLFNNEGEAGTFDLLFNKSNINWPIHQSSLDLLQKKRDYNKKTQTSIENQKRIARQERSELKKYTNHPTKQAGVYMTATQKKKIDFS